MNSRTHRRLEPPRNAMMFGLLASLAASLVLLLAVAPAIAAAPVVTAPTAENVRYTTAHFAGEVDPEDHEASYRFEYVADAAFQAGEWAEASGAGYGSLPEGSGPTPVEADVGGLQPGSTYHLRLVAENSEGERSEAVAAQTFETEAVAAPIVTIEPAGPVTPSGTHFSGTVDAGAPAGPVDAATEVAYRTEWRFDCEPACSGNLSGALEADPNGHEFPAGPVTVEGDATGLVPNTTYHVKLVATNAGGSAEANEAAGQPVQFTTAAVKPEVEEATLWNPAQTSIQLNGFVNAHNDQLTECEFVYGIGGAFDRSAPCEAPLAEESYVAASGNSPAQVSARLTGLSPGTEYSFRLSATNAAGSDEGPVQSFRTADPRASQTCPNETIREQQHAAGIPDCRAYEQVSPAEKGQGDIVADGETTIAATQGDAVEFASRTPFGDEVGSASAGQTQYVARRASDGWVSHSITPTPRPDAYQTFFTGTKIGTFSDDLTHAIVWAYDLPGGGGTPERNNVYEEDTSTRGLQAMTLSEAAKLGPFDFLNTTNWGMSEDAQHVALVTPRQLLPEAKADVSNVYQWDAGRGLSLAGILPDGTVPTAGSAVLPENYRRALSADGRRLVFTAVPNNDPNEDPELYMRIDGNTTVPISTPNGSSAFSTHVSLQAVTPDGRNVFFITDSPLASHDTNGGPDLYRWTDSGDAAHDGTITQISDTGNFGFFPGLNGVVGASDDGARIYWQTAEGRLLVSDHGSTRLISAQASFDGTKRGSLAATASMPGLGRVTPDGAWMAFVAAATLDDVHGLTGQITDGHYEMYVYSLRANTLTCVSCPVGAAASNASVVPDVTSGQPVTFYNGIRPHFLGDGGQVFFSTSEALVPEDVNGVEDVYEYDAASGTLRLVSTGRGKDPTSFADAGASGRDVFVQTRQQLVPSDHDELVDLYDVRSGGGFAEPLPPQPACLGEACKPPPTPTPVSSSASSTAAGPGNPASLHCGKHARRVRRNGKALCVSKHHHRRRRTNTTNGRAGR